MAAPTLEDRGGYGGFGGRGRGRGRGRGGFDRNGGGDFNNNKGEEGDKPREFSIPPEPTDNEEEMFATGITSGINFDKYEKIPVNVSGDICVSFYYF